MEISLLNERYLEKFMILLFPIPNTVFFNISQNFINF